jgi:2'-5' RNA ligase
MWPSIGAGRFRAEGRCGSSGLVWARGIPSSGRYTMTLWGRLEECGYAAAARPFRLHVTIGRVKQIAHEDAAQMRAVLDTVSLAVPRWLVGRVVLYESRLSTRGSTYHVLTSWPLRARPA